jgi:uncharacterized protein
VGENLDAVRRVYAFFGTVWEEAQERGEPPALALEPIFSPDVVLEEIADFPGAGSYRGYEGLGRWFADWFELYEDIRVVRLGVEEAGDRVIVATHQWFRSRAGVETEQDVVHVWTVRAGRVVHGAAFRDVAEARAAAGLDA